MCFWLTFELTLLELYYYACGFVKHGKALALSILDLIKFYCITKITAKLWLALSILDLIEFSVPPKTRQSFEPMEY